MATFLQELTRRNIVRVGMAYLALSWLILQVADIVLPAFGIAEWVLRTLIIFVGLGFPTSLVVAWIFELTPEGLKRTDEVEQDTSYHRQTGRKLDRIIIGVLALALITVVIDQYVLEAPARPVFSSLAVLPLENLSGDPEQEYFVDGMTEALITSLAKVSALRVVSRTSVMRFKDTEQALPEIARELGVDAIVEGSAIRDGDRIRITAQLVDASSDQHLWAESYDRDFSDILNLQNDIAQAIASEIELTLTPVDTEQLSQRTTVTPAGYDAYLKGQQHFYRLTPDDLQTALKYFELSLEQNPNLALAHSGVASAWIGLQQMGFVPASEASPKAEAAALRALELDENLAEAHGWLAVIKAWRDWDWRASEEEFNQAIRLNPSAGNARASFSHMLAVQGRFDEAMIQADAALEVDPFNIWFQANRGTVVHMMRRFEDSIAAFEGALKVSPSIPFAWFVLSGSYQFVGRLDDAVDAEAQLLAAMGETDAQEALLKTYREQGHTSAIKWLADYLGERSIVSGAGAAWVAVRYARANEQEKAIEFIERALEQSDPNLPYFRIPEFDELRRDPRVQKIMQSMNLL